MNKQDLEMCIVDRTPLYIVGTDYEVFISRLVDDVCIIYSKKVAFSQLSKYFIRGDKPIMVPVMEPPKLASYDEFGDNIQASAMISSYEGGWIKNNKLSKFIINTEMGKILYAGKETYEE